MRKVKYGLAGTVDKIKTEIASLRTIGGGGDSRVVRLVLRQVSLPWEEEVRQIELFAKHINPDVQINPFAVPPSPCPAGDR